MGVVRSRLPNGRELVLWSRADDWVSNLVFWRGWQGYEPETAPLFFRLASRARVTREPRGGGPGLLRSRPMLERLRSNVERSHSRNVECIAAAVGDTEGAQEFFHSPAGLPCSSSLSRGFMAHLPDLTSTTVPVVPVAAADKGAHGHGSEDGLRPHHQGPPVAWRFRVHRLDPHPVLAALLVGSQCPSEATYAAQRRDSRSRRSNVSG